MQDREERQQEAEFHAAPTMADQGKPAPQARQGIGSGRIMTILLAGVILVIVGFAVSYLGAV